MLEAVLADEQGASGVKTVQPQLSRDMSDWASSNLSKKKMPRTMSGMPEIIKKSSSFNPDAYDDLNEEIQAVRDLVRDPFLDLDEKIALE